VCDTPEKGYVCQPSVSHSWGQYSPFFSVPSDLDASIEQECEITFAQILSRHGARDPTASKSRAYNDTISRIHSSATAYGPGYEFIRDYKYALGADQLTLFGQKEMINSGIKFYHRYRSLASKSIPFIRASGQDRVVASALNWTHGYHRERVEHNTTSDEDLRFPYELVIIPEAGGVNNTLDHSLCTAFETGPSSTVGDDAQKTWLGIFAPPITERLNENLPGANLTDQEIIYVMDLCPYTTVALDDGGFISPFCQLFSEQEWRDYDYYQSVGKWYGYGPGNPLGPTQGVGFVNELIARLTRQPVRDHTSTNSTPDGSPETFPLGRTLYADFSHDNDMTAIYGAMGLYGATPPLDKTRRQTPEQTKGYTASWTVPFGARMYVEKMKCYDVPRVEAEEEEEEGQQEELVRVLVNDRVVPLLNCGTDDRGRCKLSDFVRGLEFARSGGHWDLCFV
jgi:hypothetical protein